MLLRGEIWKASQRTQADLCSDTGMKESGKDCWDKEIFVFPTCKGYWDVTLLSTQALLIRLNTGKSVLVRSYSAPLVSCKNPTVMKAEFTDRSLRPRVPRKSLRPLGVSVVDI